MFLKPKGATIKNRRESLGYSRYALSMKAGLGGNAIKRMEEGLHLVHPLRAKAIAEIFGCDIEEIFELSDEENYGNVSSM